MKKNILFYLLGLIAITFASCNPLDDAIKEIKPVSDDKTLVITTTTQYGTPEAANTGIAAMLNKSYPQFANGKKANVTYTFKTNIIKPADSVFANIQYTVTTSDYTDAAAAVGNGTFKTYSVAQAAAFLEWKYPQATTPVNKLVLLTYQFFQSNATPSAGVTVTEAFLLLANGWQKIYLVNPAQYASLGRGINNGFTSADVANLATYFNTLLKADPTVVASVGDVRYISYKYMQSSTIVHQKVYALSYDATGNWVQSLTLAFKKQDDKWIPDPTKYYTLVANDYIDIADNSPVTIGNTTNRANLKSFKNFNIVAGQTTSWSDADVNASLIYILNKKYAAAVASASVEYNVTYTYYNGSTRTGSKIFVKTDTGFTFVRTI